MSTIQQTPLQFAAIRDMFRSGRTQVPELGDYTLPQFARAANYLTGTNDFSQAATDSQFESIFKSGSAAIDDFLEANIPEVLDATESYGRAIGEMIGGEEAIAAGAEAGRHLPRGFVDFGPAIAGAGIGGTVGGPVGAAAGGFIGLGASAVLAGLNALEKTDDPWRAAITAGITAVGPKVSHQVGNLAVHGLAKTPVGKAFATAAEDLAFIKGVPTPVKTLKPKFAGEVASFTAGQTSFMALFEGTEVAMAAARGEEYNPFTRATAAAHLTGLAPFSVLDLAHRVPRAIKGENAFITKRYKSEEASASAELATRNENFDSEIPSISNEAEPTAQRAVQELANKETQLSSEERSNRTIELQKYNPQAIDEAGPSVQSASNARRYLRHTSEAEIKQIATDLGLSPEGSHFEVQMRILTEAPREKVESLSQRRPNIGLVASAEEARNVRVPREELREDLHESYDEVVRRSNEAIAEIERQFSGETVEEQRLDPARLLETKAELRKAAQVGESQTVTREAQDSLTRIQEAEVVRQPELTQQKYDFDVERVQRDARRVREFVRVRDGEELSGPMVEQDAVLGKHVRSAVRIEGDELRLGDKHLALKPFESVRELTERFGKAGVEKAVFEAFLLAHPEVLKTTTREVDTTPPEYVIGAKGNKVSIKTKGEKKTVTEQVVDTAKLKEAILNGSPLIEVIRQGHGIADEIRQRYDLLRHKLEDDPVYYGNRWHLEKAFREGITLEGAKKRLQEEEKFGALEDLEKQEAEVVSRLEEIGKIQRDYPDLAAGKVNEDIVARYASLSPDSFEPFNPVTGLGSIGGIIRVNGSGFDGGHTGELGALGWWRGKIVEHEGKKKLRIDVLQSDAAQNHLDYLDLWKLAETVHKGNDSYAFVLRDVNGDFLHMQQETTVMMKWPNVTKEGRKLTAEEKKELIQGHPLFDEWHNIFLRDIVQVAKDNGAEVVFAPDAVTIGMSQGHLSQSGFKGTAEEALGVIIADTPGIKERGALSYTEDTLYLNDQAIGHYHKNRDTWTLNGRAEEEGIVLKPNSFIHQEGHEAFYAGKVWNSLKKLTGNEGVDDNLGAHKQPTEGFDPNIRGKSFSLENVKAESGIGRLRENPDSKVLATEFVQAGRSTRIGLLREAERLELGEVVGEVGQRVAYDPLIHEPTVGRLNKPNPPIREGSEVIVVEPGFIAKDGNDLSLKVAEPPEVHIARAKKAVDEADYATAREELDQLPPETAEEFIQNVTERRAKEPHELESAGDVLAEIGFINLERGLRGLPEWTERQLAREVKAGIETGGDLTEQVRNTVSNESKKSRKITEEGRRKLADAGAKGGKASGEDKQLARNVREFLNDRYEKNKGKVNTVPEARPEQVMPLRDAANEAIKAARANSENLSVRELGPSTKRDDVFRSLDERISAADQQRDRGGAELSEQLTAIRDQLPAQSDSSLLKAAKELPVRQGSSLAEEHQALIKLANHVTGEAKLTETSVKENLAKIENTFYSDMKDAIMRKLNRQSGLYQDELEVFNKYLTSRKNQFPDDTLADTKLQQAYYKWAKEVEEGRLINGKTKLIETDRAEQIAILEGRLKEVLFRAKQKKPVQRSRFLNKKKLTEEGIDSLDKEAVTAKANELNAKNNEPGINYAVRKVSPSEGDGYVIIKETYEIGVSPESIEQTAAFQRTISDSLETQTPTRSESVPVEIRAAEEVRAERIDEAILQQGREKAEFFLDDNEYASLLDALENGKATTEFQGKQVPVEEVLMEVVRLDEEGFSAQFFGGEGPKEVRVGNVLGNLPDLAQRLMVKMGATAEEAAALRPEFARLQKLFAMDPLRFGELYNDNAELGAFGIALRNSKFKGVFLAEIQKGHLWPNADRADALKFVAAHEIGHIVDYLHQEGKLPRSVSKKLDRFEEWLGTANKDARKLARDVMRDSFLPEGTNRARLDELLLNTESGLSRGEVKADMIALWAMGMHNKNPGNTRFGMGLLPRPVVDFLHTLTRYARRIFKSMTGASHLKGDKRGMKGARLLDEALDSLVRSKEHTDNMMAEYMKIERMGPHLWGRTMRMSSFEVSGRSDGTVRLKDFTPTLKEAEFIRRIQQEGEKGGANSMMVKIRPEERVVAEGLRRRKLPGFRIDKENEQGLTRVHMDYTVPDLNSGEQLALSLFGEAQLKRAPEGDLPDAPEQRFAADPSRAGFSNAVSRWFNEFIMPMDQLAAQLPELAPLISTMHNFTSQARSLARRWEAAVTASVGANGEPIWTHSDEQAYKRVRIDYKEGRNNKLLSDWFRLQNSKKDENGNIPVITLDKMGEYDSALKQQIDSLPQKDREALTLMHARIGNMFKQIHTDIIDMERAASQKNLERVLALKRGDLWAQAPELIKELGQIAKMRQVQDPRFAESYRLFVDKVGKETTDQLLNTAELYEKNLAELAVKLDQRPGFTSEIRTGKYLLRYKVPGVEGESTLGFDNRSQMKKFIETDVAKKGGEVLGTEQVRRGRKLDLDPDMLDFLDEWHQKLNEQIEEQGIGMSQEQKDTLKTLTNIRSEVERNFAAHKIHDFGSRRRLAGGREYLDMLDTQFSYVNSLSHALAARLFKQDVGYHRANPELLNFPEEAALIDRAISNFVTPNTQLGSTIASANAGYFLGLNPSSNIVELSQSLQTFVPEAINRGVGFFEANKMLTNAQMESFRYTLDKNVFSRPEDPHTAWKDPEVQKLMRWATDKALIRLGHASDAIESDTTSAINLSSLQGKGTTLDPGDMAGTWIRQFANTSLRLYRATTEHNSRIALMMGLELAKKQGLTGERAFESAAEYMRTVTFAGGKANRPVAAFENEGHFRTMGQAYYSLQSFTFNILAMMKRYAENGYSKKSYPHLTEGQRKQARNAFNTMMSTQFALAGAVGMPFVGAALSLIEKNTNLTPKTDLRLMLAKIFNEDAGQGGMLTDLVMKGAASAIGSRGPIGVDVSSRLSIGGVLGLNPYDGFSAADVFGPSGAVVNRFFTGASEIAQTGDVLGGLAKAAPPNIIGKALQLASDGFEFRDQGGGLLTDGTMGEKFAYIAGFRPSRISNLREAEAMQKQLREVERRKDGLQLDRIANLYLQNPTAARIALLEYTQSSNSLDLQTAANRIAERVEKRTMPKDVRREASGRTAEGESRILQTFPQLSPSPSEIERLFSRAQVRGNLGSLKTPLPSELRKAQLVDMLMRQRPDLTLIEARSLADQMIGVGYEGVFQ